MEKSQRVSFDGKGVIEGNELFDADKAVLAARNFFNADFLFPWQRIVIANILDQDIYRGRQIVLLPTGAGKTLCFLVPALLLEGATLVIYPLLALMNDQKRRMEKAGIKCVIFKGGQTEEEREKNFKELEQKENPARVIITNPESLCKKELISRLSQIKISHIAIDEAHCVSEWGDSFRPSYLELGRIIKELKCPFITAFTATASPQVLQRIGSILFDGFYYLVKGNCDRPNIHYEVLYAYAKEKAALELALSMKKPLIIFCSSRSRTEKMAHILTAYFGHEKVRFYHAGLTREEKTNVEQWFYSSGDGILTATCAYGMGVDKSDIAAVIHLDAPEHLENFVQEAGRAGRNGEDVKSVLIWNHKDSVKWTEASQGSREKAMGDYALSGKCRRQVISDYFKNEETFCTGCDICDAKQKGKNISYKARDAEIAFNFIKHNRRLYTRQEAIEKLTERFNSLKLKTFRMNIWETKDSAEILSQLISERRLRLCHSSSAGKIDIRKKQRRIKLLSLIPRRHLHHLHRLRHYFRSFQAAGQQLLSLL